MAIHFRFRELSSFYELLGLTDRIQAFGNRGLIFDWVLVFMASRTMHIRVETPHLEKLG